MEKTSEEFEQTEQEAAAHCRLAAAERTEYQDKRAEAAQFPHHVLSLIIDGSHGACVPWMRQPPSQLTAMFRIPFTITSVIDHGHQETDALIVPPLWAHDANLFLSILHQRLLHLLDNGHRLGQPTLYLQLDNCVRENKNRFVFGYLAHLVHTGGM